MNLYFIAFLPHLCKCARDIKVVVGDRRAGVVFCLIKDGKKNEANGLSRAPNPAYIENFLRMSSEDPTA